MNKPIQEVRAFKRRSAFTRFLGKRLTDVFYLICNDPDYRKQAPEASRNIELIAEDLFRVCLKYPGRFSSLLSTVFNWQNKYYSAHEDTKQMDAHYLMYTELDHSIPFKPEVDTHYSCILSQASCVTYHAAAMMSDQLFERSIAAFKEINFEAARTFLAYPERVPRFTDHKRLQLATVQKYDPPFNNCPSLHITYSTLLYNVADQLLQLPDKHPAAAEFVRVAAHGMINTVLHIKQHSLEDVAAGILLAETIYGRHFKRAPPFDNLTGEFSSLEKAFPDIPYTQIQERYERMKWHMAREKDYVLAIAARVKEAGYQLVKANEPTSYWDTQTKRIVPLLSEVAGSFVH